MLFIVSWGITHFLWTVFTKDPFSHTSVFCVSPRPEQRYEYANKLKSAVTQLRAAGERLGKYELEKRHAIENENFDRAKLKKQLADEYREQVYKALEIEDLLERKGVCV